MGQHTKEEWVRASSISGRINVLWSEWAEKRKESPHYGQIGSSGSDTTGHTTRHRMRYEWNNKGVMKRVSTWPKAVKNAMLKGGAEFQRQKALNRARSNGNKGFLRTTDIGVARIRQVACTRSQM